MGDVYKFAIFNIAATHATNGGEGCFRSRTLMEVESSFIRATWDHLPDTTYYCHDIDRPKHELDQGPLLSRAWVLQEIALAPRVIHYTKSQVYWECAELRACEAFPEGIPYNTIPKLGINSSTVSSGIPWLFPTPSAQYHRFAIWKELVNHYTAANLTFPIKDKLIAISGLASYLGSTIEYAAGLWTPYFADELQWKVDKGRHSEQRSRSPEYRAPSWSWASIDGPVRAEIYTGVGKHSQAVDFLDVSTQPLHENRFRQLARAHIRLKGCLVCCRASIRTRLLTMDISLRGGKFVEVPRSVPKIMYGKYLEDAHCGINLDEGEINDGDVVYCLPLKMEQEKNSGILLTPTSLKGQFMRCGFFETYDSHDDFRCHCKKSPISIDDQPDLYERRAGMTAEGYRQYIVTLV